MSIAKQQALRATNAIENLLFYLPHLTSQKTLALAILEIARYLTETSILGDSIAESGIKNAIEHAKKKDFEMIAYVATESMERDPNENEMRLAARSFLKKALGFSCATICCGDRPAYCAQVKLGMELLYQQDPNVNWEDKVLQYIIKTDTLPAI